MPLQGKRLLKAGNSSTFMNTDELLIASADWFPLVLSLKVATVATLPALVAGWRYSACAQRFPGRTVLEAVFRPPLVLPPTVIGWRHPGGGGAPTACSAAGCASILTTASSSAGMAPSSPLPCRALPLVLKSASAALVVDRLARMPPPARCASRRSRRSCTLAAGAWPGIPGRHAARICARHGRIRRLADGGGFHSAADPDPVDGHLRRGAGRA